MLVLLETAAGFAIFKMIDEGKLEPVENIWKHFENSENALKLVKLESFLKFKDTASALEVANDLVESKLPKRLKKFLKKAVKDSNETLGVADAKLGSVIKSKMGIDCICTAPVLEVLRGIKEQIELLVSDLSVEEMKTMTLGLSHSMTHHVLQLSPEKVDQMVIQAVCLLDELEKEINTYSMRLKEWYGWHFPEMAKIVLDNLEYAKVVNKIGTRDFFKSSDADLSEILNEEIIEQLRSSSAISMGTEINEMDSENIRALCKEIISMSEYRTSLQEYLSTRMKIIAPNLSVMVGELVGARLISHAGSLLNLAKHPASTIQIFGAEKALFRALKTKNQTPKYGLIFHASLVGQSTLRNKPKISRAVGAKTAICARVDAFGKETEPIIGQKLRMKVETRLKMLENQKIDGPVQKKIKRF